MSLCRPLVSCLVLAFGLICAQPLFAAEKMRTASLPVQVPAAVIAGPLSKKDVDLYGRIFALQETGNWRAADKLITQLSNRSLMGHVKAQRYLHPTKYRSRYKELKAWMAAYADHPDAARLYKLALKRRPANWKYPRRPSQPGRSWSGFDSDREAAPRAPRKRLSRSQHRRARTLMHMVRSYLRKGATKAAKQVIGSQEARRLWSTAQMDEMRGRLGYAYLMDGRSAWAYDWAGKAADRSGKYVVQAHWVAGLAAWRLNKLEEAAAHFEAVATAPGESPWMTSAGAFWAARSHLVNRRPARVSMWLERAAASPRTFYGLLANRLLGREHAMDFAQPDLKPSLTDTVVASQRGRRALALLQVGQERRAERELRNLALASDRKTAQGIMVLSSRIGLEALSVRLGRMLYPGGGGPAAVAYPLPDWEPADGFRVDRALIYALVRQESGFNPKAKSGVGARGLMQLMPRTASFVARDRRFHRTRAQRRALFNPDVNLTLGQRYIEILLSDRKISGDLFLMAAAWNGGPGNLNKWRRRVDDGNDPLFFIETLPSRETRIFIERVLSNFWIYRQRLDQPVPSLDAIAAGRWPVYTALDNRSVQVAESGGAQR